MDVKGTWPEILYWVKVAHDDAWGGMFDCGDEPVTSLIGEGIPSQMVWQIGPLLLAVNVWTYICMYHCLVYLVIFNTDSSILGSTRFWVLIR